MIGQNLKHTDVTSSFPELLIFFDLFQAWFLATSKKYFTEIHTPNDEKRNKEIYIFKCLRCYIKESCFLMWSLKFLINDFCFFSLSLTYFFYKLKGNHGLYKTDLFYIQSVLYRLWSKSTVFPYMPQQRCWASTLNFLVITS